MSNVNLAIGGRQFVVACAEGEEQHVASLGRMIDGKLADMGDTSAQSESRMLLFAALLLADDLHEASQNLPGGPPAADLGKLELMATRLENIADRLEA